MTLAALLDKARSLLQGEPVRVITYGAIAIVWVVTHVAFALGLGHTPPPVDAVLVAVTAAIAAVNEAIRLVVFSPASVAALQPPAPIDPSPVLVDEPAQG